MLCKLKHSYGENTEDEIKTNNTNNYNFLEMQLETVSQFVALLCNFAVSTETFFVIGTGNTINTLHTYASQMTKMDI
jgi:hypothetical protein